MLKLNKQAVIAIFLSTLISGPSLAEEQRILVQSTTSTQNSGLYDYILPIFEEETGLNVDVVAVGTGQAIRNAGNGDADVLLVHAKAAEEAFVADGFGVMRFDLMYNDFVIIGPASDPSQVGQAAELQTALDRLYTGVTPFVSRGDDSGTHKAELRLWALRGDVPNMGMGWYREVGAGMGATIRTAIEMQAYTLTDRATWIAYGHKQDFTIVFEGEKELFNQYGIIAVNPELFPHINAEGAKVFIDWMLSAHGQELIADYLVEGQQLFFPNASLQ